MTTESTFRAIALLNIVVCLPIGLYFRIRSQATRERLARKEEGVLDLPPENWANLKRQCPPNLV